MTLINDEITARLGRQSQAASSLDTKATLLVGFSVTAIPLLLGSDLNWWFGVPALIAFGAALVFGLLVVRPRKFEDPPNPSGVAGDYREPVRKILGTLITMRVDAFEKNKAINDDKNCKWESALVALLVAALLSVPAIAVGRTADDARGTEQQPCGPKAAGAATGAAA